MKAKSNNYRGKVDISVSQNFITSKNTIYKLIKKTNISKNVYALRDIPDVPCFLPGKNVLPFFL